MVTMLNNKNMLQEAIELQQTGNFDAAEILYKKILEKQPQNIEVISLLGALNLQIGNLDEALLLLKKSLELKPDNAITLNNIGSVFQSSGRLKEAIASYKQAITLKPDYDEAYYNLGNAYQAACQFEDAIESYNQAITLKPDDADIYSNLANVLRKSNRLEEALVSYKQATIFMPLNAELHNNLGAALQELGKFDEAVWSYRQAIKLDPEYAKAHNNLGSAFNKLHNLKDAIKCFNRAIELKPDYADAFYNLGSALHTSGRFDDAIDAYTKAITNKPLYAKAYYNLGNTLKEQNKIKEALESYKEAITINPDYEQAHNNLGTMLQEQGKIDEAEKCYNHAKTLKPDYVDAHLNLAFTSLLKEDFKRGWQEFEWRLRTENYRHRKFNHPMWDGKPLNGKTILIHTEQGFGDTIQFFRYLTMIQEQGGRVIFECERELFSLLKNCAGFEKIVEKKSNGELSEQFDVHAPLLSLPGLFGTTTKSIPSDIPYISADQDLMEQWRLRLDGDSNFKIGIVWAGNPNHKKDHFRSCSLSYFFMLAEIPGFSIYSLQKGDISDELDKCPSGEKIINLNNEINDFTDTAAIIANLDYVISVDTVVAHLAGAIGKPVWTLLPFVPDWRWLLNRNDCPWYPSMRLFRQTSINDWAGVFERVKDALLDNFRLRSTDDKGKKLLQSTIQNQKFEMKSPTISLCMIVKNEEENLARCLKSAVDVVDEIIVVDTGSTDNTVAIAESYGARVFNHPWEGSFSKARNYSLKYATCDWILILDADHELDKADAHKLKEAVKTKDANYIHLSVYDIHEGGKNLGVYDFGLLFKNHLGFHYRGTVHNELIFSGKIKRYNIKVYHYGNDLSLEQMEKKFIRTSTLLKEQIKSDPDNPIPHRYLGDAYLRMKMYDEAIEESMKALSLIDESKCTTENFMISYYIICASYYEKKDMESARKYALKAIEIDDQQIDIICILALVYFNTKEFDKYLQCSKRYLDLWNYLRNNNENKVNPFVYHTIGHKWKIHLLRGLYYLSIGQVETGNSEIETAMEESTDIENCLTILGNYYMENNNTEKAENVYKKLLDINEKSVSALFNLGQTNFKRNNMEGTISFWRKAVEIAPDSYDIRLLICTINIEQGNLEEVITDCDQLLQVLNMPRDVTIDSLIDLTNLFNLIGEELKKRNDLQSAEIATRISKNLVHIEQNESGSKDKEV